MEFSKISQEIVSIWLPSWWAVALFFFNFYEDIEQSKEAQWPTGYGVGLRIKRSSVRIRPWPLRWVLGQGSLLPLSQGEAFTLASISYLATLVKDILAKKKKKKKKKTVKKVERRANDTSCRSRLCWYRFESLGRSSLILWPTARGNVRECIFIRIWCSFADRLRGLLSDKTSPGGHVTAEKSWQRRSWWKTIEREKMIEYPLRVD